MSTKHTFTLVANNPDIRRTRPRGQPVLVGVTKESKFSFIDYEPFSFEQFKNIPPQSTLSEEDFLFFQQWHDLGLKL